MRIAKTLFMLVLGLSAIFVLTACSKKETPAPVVKAPSRAFLMGKNDACTKHLSYQECIAFAARHGILITMGTGRAERGITPDEARRIESLTTRFQVTTKFVVGDYVDPDENKFIPSPHRSSGGEKSLSRPKKRKHIASAG